MDSQTSGECSKSYSEKCDTEKMTVKKGRDWVGSIKMGVFIVGTALLVLAAARNSITWYIQLLWGASADFWQKSYDSVYIWCGNNDFNITVYGTFSLITLAYWVSNSFFIILDITGHPKFLKRYKIQPGTNAPLDMKKFKRALKLILFNQFVVGFGFTYCLYYIFKARGCPMSGDMPSFQWVLVEIFVFTLAEEVGFYYSHRLMHHPRIYKHMHKIHHEWPASISIISVYCHPVEQVVSNLAPVALGPFIMGSHLGTFWLWATLVLLNTTISHSGYHFPFLSSPEAHDYHHQKFNQNFGTLGVLDRLHGTDEQFRASKEYQRHIMLLNLTPARELFPDDVKGNKKSQ